MPRLRLAPPTRGALWLPFAALSAVHIGAKLAGAGRLDRVSKALLIPALGVRLIGVRQHRRRRLALLAIEMSLSWIGDLTIALSAPGSPRSSPPTSA